MSDLIIRKSHADLMSAYSEKDLQLIRDTIAKNATDQEFELFIYRCQLMGLNPFKPGHIHFIKYGNNPGTIVIGIEGFRYKAQETGKLAGIKRGVIKNDKGQLLGAWAEVYRSDWKEPAREEVSFAEYNKGSGTWRTMPETMIKKVAEVAALRMAFSDDLGGLYENSEFKQVPDTHEEETKEEKKTIQVESVVTDKVSNEEYVIPFGPHRDKPLHAVPINELVEYAKGLVNYGEKTGKAIPEMHADFIERVRSIYLKDEVKS